MSKIVYKSNGQVIGDGVRVTRVSNGGQKLEVMTDTKAETYSEVVLKDDAPVDPIDPDPVGGGDDTLTGPSDTLPGGGGSDTVTGGGGQPPATNTDVVIGPRAIVQSPVPGSVVIRVDSTIGDDANDGILLPVRTLARARAVAQAVAKPVTVIANGTFRETFQHTLHDLALIPGPMGCTISGGEPLNGFAPAGPGDLEWLADTAGVFVARGIPVSRFPSGKPGAALLMEDGKRLIHATTLKPGGPDWDRTSNNDLWLDAQLGLVGTTISTVHLPGVPVSSLNLTDATVLLYGGANHSFTSAVASVDAAGVIRLANQSVVAAPTSNPDRNKVALTNFGPALKPGGWFYVLEPGGTCAIYVKPHDPARVNLSVTAAARGQGINLGTGTRNPRICGIRVEQISDATGQDANGQYPIYGKNTSGAVIMDCEIEDASRAAEDYGMIHLVNPVDPLIMHNSLARAKNMFGVFIQGIGAKNAKRPVIAFNKFDEIDNTCIRIYGADLPVTVFNRGRNSGDLPHANQWNAYQGCSDQLVYGNIFLNSAGYITNQEAEGMFLAFTLAVTGWRDGKRAIDTQSKIGSHITAQTTGEGLMLCTMVPPHGLGAGVSNSTALGDTIVPGVRYRAIASITHGMKINTPSALPGGRNLHTAGVKTYADDVMTTPQALYMDPAKGDWRYRPDAAIRTLPRGDITAEIAVMQQLFPHAPAGIWDRDLTGARFDPTRAPVGPVDDYDADPLAFAWVA